MQRKAKQRKGNRVNGKRKKGRRYLLGPQLVLLFSEFSVRCCERVDRRLESGADSSLVSTGVYVQLSTKRQARALRCESTCIRKRGL